MTGLMLLVAAVLLAVGVLAMRAGDAAQLRRSLVVIELVFPRDLAEDAVQAFLGAVSGLLPPWWRRWWHLPFIGLEVQADHHGIQHRLLVPARWQRAMETALAAHLPGTHYMVLEHPGRPSPMVAAEYRLTNAERSLAVAAGPVSAGLLSALQPLAAGETITIQTLLAPARPVPPAEQALQQNDVPTWFGGGTSTVSGEAVAALRKKQGAPLLLACLRIGTAAGSIGRARALLRDSEATWHSTRAPGALLRRRAMSAKTASQRLRAISVPLLGWPVLLNTVEAAGLVGVPVEADSLPGVHLVGCRPLAVPEGVPTTGTVLGIGSHPRSQRPVALDTVARTHHALVIGPTGSGKSVLLSRMAIGDAAAPGRPVVVVDPKDGELIERVVRGLPERRLRDVIVFDPTDERPVGFDPLRATPDTRELVVDRVLGLMSDIWGDNLGPRSSDILRHVLLTVASSPSVRMTEAPLLLVDEAFRRHVVKAEVPGGAVRAWWAWVDTLSPAEWSAMTQAPLNKLRAFVGRSAVADAIGQDQPTIDFDRVLAKGQIVLARLPMGLLGEETTALLGAMFLSQLWHAIAARAALHPTKRQTASVIVDEVGTVLRFPAGSMEYLLTQARGYRVGVTMAAQQLVQLPSAVRAAALANARTKVVFACGREDAGVLARELGHGLTAEDVMGIEAYDAVAAVYAAGRTQAPATLHTLPPDNPLRDSETVFALSRQRWGVDRAELRTTRSQRQVSRAAETPPVGRRRRGQP